MKKHLGNISKNEEGAALILAMMVLLVLTALGTMVGVVTVGSYKLGDHNRELNSAYYIAEAGANMAYEEIKNKAESFASDSDKEGSVFRGEVDGQDDYWTFEYKGKPHFKEQFGESPEAIVKVISENKWIIEGNISSKKYIIQSTGNVAGKKRIVNKPFIITWHEKSIENSDGGSLELPKNAAIIFNGKVDFGNNNDVTVEGGVIGDSMATVDGKGNNVPALENLDLDWDSYIKALDNLPEMIEKTPVGDWVIDTDGQTLNYRVDSLNFKNNSISVEGGGTVNIFLKIPFTNSDFNNSNKITKKVDGRLNIIYTGSGSFSFGNGSSGEFVLFAPKATVNFDNSATLYGSIVVKDATFKKDSKVIFPNGLTYDFPFGSSQELGDEGLETNIDLITTSPAIEQ